MGAISLIYGNNDFDAGTGTDPLTLSDGSLATGLTITAFLSATKDVATAEAIDEDDLSVELEEVDATAVYEGIIHGDKITDHLLPTDPEATSYKNKRVYLHYMSGSDYFGYRVCRVRDGRPI